MSGEVTCRVCNRPVSRPRRDREGDTLTCSCKSTVMFDTQPALARRERLRYARDVFGA